MDEPTVQQTGLGDLDAEPGGSHDPSPEPVERTGSLFADPVAPAVTPAPAPPVALPVAPEPGPVASPLQAGDPPPDAIPAGIFAEQLIPAGPPVASEAAPTAAAPAPGTQPSLLDSADVAVVVAAVPPAAAAKAADLTGATNVATYGDRDLDEMVAELAKSAPVAGAAAGAAVAAGVVVPTEGGVAPEQASATPEAPADGVASPEEVPAPATAEGDAVEADALPGEAVSAPNWPFLVYAGVWAIFAIGLAFVMKPAAVGGSVFASPYYRLFLGGGLALAIVGPILVLVVWLFARRGYAKGHRTGLFSSALIKGALALFVGVLLWWAAYYAAVWLAASGR